MNIITKKMNLPDGREITVQTGKLAKQSDGAVEVRIGDTVLLATAVAAKSAKPGVDFMPLTIDYREKYAAAGKFPGGFFKREARPSEYEILTMRLVDRALRPLFPEDFHADTQVMIQLLSADENMADSLACFAASAALACSDIPFETPCSEVRISRVDGEFVINPTYEQNAKADMDMVIAGTKDSIMMVEGEMAEISEAEMIDAIKTAHEVIKQQCAISAEFMKELGKETKREYSHETHDEEIRTKIHNATYEKCMAVARQGLADKAERGRLFGEIKEEYIASLSEEELEDFGGLVSKYYRKAEKAAIRDLTLNEGLRLDGRKTVDIRPIWCEIDYLPSTHGSAIFTRGETQALATVTLGTSRDANKIDMPSYEGEENFYLHYNFPPFCTGEARPIRGTSRREVGHGNLAQRALKGMVPDDCPYTVRVVSEVLESNGSSSMATVCSGTMAMMDAGVQLKKPVSGIAMGLISDADSGKYAVLSDILGDEDHLGDMDFKVTGTRDGITAVQMDIKVDGLSMDVMRQALAQANKGRLHILDAMYENMPTHREEMKPQTPRMLSINIDREFIGAIIGPGGKVIQELQRETGTNISIEEVDEQGIVKIFSADAAGADKAMAFVKGIVATPEVGEEYDSIVKSIMPYGAFVEFMPGKQGLLHISEVSHERLENMDGAFKEGDSVKVKLVGLDKKTGKFKLSRKVLLPKEEKA